MILAGQISLHFVAANGPNQTRSALIGAVQRDNIRVNIQAKAHTLLRLLQRGATYSKLTASL